MISYFERLGRHIEDAWRARGYDEEVFPELVTDELAKQPPAEHVDVTRVMDWIFGPHQAFRQPSPPRIFGEPPVMVFQGPRFYIEILFWRSGTTEIHEHSFSGAFSVLAGSSVHSHWRFTREKMINSRMLRGHLERVTTEILRPGGVRPIRSGNRLIHQLFHLDLPSVTIVVRTYSDKHHLPQYRYMPPGLAIESDDRDPTRLRRIMLLDGMASEQIEGLPRYARMLVENADLETIYYAFLMLTKRKVSPDLLGELFGVARRIYGDIIDLFREVCEWERRTHVVITRRARITDPDQRFLLALLMLFPDRDAILDAVRLQRPDVDPLMAIEALLAGMSGKETIGFEFNDVNRILFRGLVQGLGTEDLLQRIRDEFKADHVETNRDRLLAHAKELARSDLFHPLFSGSPLREAPPPL